MSHATKMLISNAHKHCYKLETTARITTLIWTSAYANKPDMNTG